MANKNTLATMAKCDIILLAPEMAGGRYLPQKWGDAYEQVQKNNGDYYHHNNNTCPNVKSSRLRLN